MREKMSYDERRGRGRGKIRKERTRIRSGMNGMVRRGGGKENEEKEEGKLINYKEMRDMGRVEIRSGIRGTVVVVTCRRDNEWWRDEGKVTEGKMHGDKRKGRVRGKWVDGLEGWRGGGSKLSTGWKKERWGEGRGRTNIEGRSC